MSTLNIFREMSGITETSILEITSERAQEIVQTVSAFCPQQSTSVPLSLVSVSTYVVEAKNPDAGSVYVSPKQPSFASHWGIVVGDMYHGIQVATLYHLVLKDDGDGHRRIRFEARNVEAGDISVKGAAVKTVGSTRYDHPYLIYIGNKMIEAFGNYHLIFWNCQMFAKCYLSVITDDVAVFDEWTSADVTNLFLCALVIPASIGSSNMSKQASKERQLKATGTRAATTMPLGVEIEQSNVSEEQLLKMSDQVIDKMIESWKDDETLKKFYSIKDSSNKSGFVRRLWSMFFS